ncbi:hypothetical protein [Halopseudomonas sp.]|uniref:hypothetical protein n=1 Tax=Halopseudomonas sp. TaxID=2901191 RepID=UPI00300284BA
MARLPRLYFPGCAQHVIQRGNNRTVYRYIELNPVRARMVSHASEYPWSSYQSNAAGKSINLLTPHTLYLRLGDTDAERQEAYTSLFRGTMPERVLTAIRDTTNKGWVLGNDRFKAQIEARTGRRTTPLGRGGDRRSGAYRENKDQLL